MGGPKKNNNIQPVRTPCLQCINEGKSQYMNSINNRKQTNTICCYFMKDETINICAYCKHSLDNHIEFTNKSTNKTNATTTVSKTNATTTVSKSTANFSINDFTKHNTTRVDHRKKQIAIQQLETDEYIIPTHNNKYTSNYSLDIIKKMYGLIYNDIQSGGGFKLRKQIYTRRHKKN